MIVRPRPGFFGLLLIMRGSIMPTIAPRLVTVLALSSGITALERVGPLHFRDLTPAPFTLLGIALSIFLGFRNNTCYERWWEARRLWGQIVAETRALVRDGVSLLPDERTRRRLAHRTIAFARALRDQLRGVASTDIGDWLPIGEWDRIALCRSRPDAILRAQMDEFGKLLREGALTDNLYRLFSERLHRLTCAQSSCERLRSTPTPFTYTLLLHRTAWLFCLLLPFGLVSTIGLATPVLTTILAYTFFGLDALGDELEEPFGVSPNDVPLDTLVRAIEIAALEAIGETDLPKPLQPEGFVLH